MSKSESIQTLELKISEVVEQVSREAKPHFYRDEVVVMTMRNQYIHALMKGTNSVVREIIVRWLETEISDALQAKDAYGIRLYENYPTRKVAESEGFGGQRRWLRTGSQSASMFRLLAKQPEREARQLMAKSDVYIEISERLETLSKRAGRDVVWDEVRDQIGPQLAVLRQRVASILRS